MYWPILFLADKVSASSPPSLKRAGRLGLHMPSKRKKWASLGQIFLERHLIGMLPSLVGKIFPLVHFVQLLWKPGCQIVPTAYPFLKSLVNRDVECIQI